MYRAAVVIVALTFFPSVVAAQQPCTTDANQVVNEIYRHILERGADSGASHWVQQLRNGATVREVVRDIAKSPGTLTAFLGPGSWRGNAVHPCGRHDLPPHPRPSA
jgi:hypothetical protein